MDECIHGIYPVESCTICNGRDAREKREGTSTIVAKYYGSCSDCSMPIKPGDLIKEHIIYGVWKHHDC